MQVSLKTTFVFLAKFWKFVLEVPEGKMVKTVWTKSDPLSHSRRAHI